MASSNRSNVPETKGATEKNPALAGMKQQAAHEPGVNLKKGCSGDPTARENGGKSF